MNERKFDNDNLTRILITAKCYSNENLKKKSFIRRLKKIVFFFTNKYVTTSKCKIIEIEFLFFFFVHFEDIQYNSFNVINKVS